MVILSSNVHMSVGVKKVKTRSEILPRKGLLVISFEIATTLFKINAQAKSKTILMIFRRAPSNKYF